MKCILSSLSVLPTVGLLLALGVSGCACGNGGEEGPSDAGDSGPCSNSPLYGKYLYQFDKAWAWAWWEYDYFPTNCRFGSPLGGYEGLSFWDGMATTSQLLRSFSDDDVCEQSLEYVDIMRCMLAHDSSIYIFNYTFQGQDRCISHHISIRRIMSKTPEELEASVGSKLSEDVMAAQPWFSCIPSGSDFM